MQQRTHNLASSQRRRPLAWLLWLLTVAFLLLKPVVAIAASNNLNPATYELQATTKPWRAGTVLQGLLPTAIVNAHAQGGGGGGAQGGG